MKNNSDILWENLKYLATPCIITKSSKVMTGCKNAWNAVLYLLTRHDNLPSLIRKWK